MRISTSEAHREVLSYPGFFYQQQTWFDTAFVGDEGLTPIVREGLITSMYAGAIFHRDHDERKELVGAMSDEFGRSELRDITLTDTDLQFTKHYKTHEIQYILKKGEDNTWVGEFSFRSIPSRVKVRLKGKGSTRCILTQVDWGLFKRDIAKFLDEAAGQVGIDFDELAQKESKRFYEEQEKRDDEIEESLKRLLANPAAAEEAFPNPQIREGVLPLIQRVRKKAREARRNS
ncbi:MAG TPA: hypothetical protein VG934_00235 [Candidatus Paceibacterota bacterium]|nr:hypothetical protein [Candidatus Paceibacterota bacterium]